MANKSIILLALVIGISGCVSAPEPTTITKVETVTVYKPVFRVPDELVDVDIPSRPDLPSNYLTKEDQADPGKVVKVVIQSMAMLREYAESLEDQLELYNTTISTAIEQSNKDGIE